MDERVTPSSTASLRSVGSRDPARSPACLDSARIRSASPRPRPARAASAACAPCAADVASPDARIAPRPCCWPCPFRLALSLLSALSKRPALGHVQPILPIGLTHYYLLT